MTDPKPLTLAGRPRRVAPPRPALTTELPRPHVGRRHHWVTVASRRIAAEDHPAAVPHTQLLQSCSRGCGRHRTTVLAGHWQARDVVHPAAQTPPRQTVVHVEIEGREIARAVHRYADDRTARQ